MDLTTTKRRRGLRASLLALAGTAALLAGAGTGTAPARAEVCAGSNGRPCPYLSVQVIGRRAEGALRFPEAVALDAQGDVYVADQLGYVVQKFSATGTFETEWGSYGGGHGQFGPIGGLAVDGAGNVYVVDSANDRIQKFAPDGSFITAWGGRGSALGKFSFGSSQNPTQPPGGGIAVTGGYVYVADSGNDRIERFNLSGGEAMQWGSPGSGAGQFSFPRGVAAGAGEVIVSDDDNHRIEKFDLGGAFQGATGTHGAGPGQFGFPFGVALDAAGNVFVADDNNHRVVKLTAQLAFAGAWGGFGSKPGQLAFPRALASDPAGDTFVADTANDRVQEFTPSGEFVRVLGASARGEGIFTAPRGLGLDPTGTLLVSDTIGNRIERFSPTGYAGQWSDAGGLRPGFNAPAGIAVDERGSVWVADPGNERVARLWGDGTFLSELGGPSVAGGAPLSGAGSVAVAQGPEQTYVADSGHNRILVYSPAGQLLARWGAGAGSGAPGMGAGAFNHPDAVALDSAADAYVADTGNNRVVKLSPDGRVVAQFGASGRGEGRFRSPTGIAVDALDRVYVVDSGNNRVEVFDRSGRLLTLWGVRGAGAGAFSQPTAIAVDCGGEVYVADTNNNRVERFNLVSPAPTGCLAQGSWPPPLDVAPVISLSLASSAGVLAQRALVLALSCQRGCRALVTATLTPPGGRRQVPLGAAFISLAPSSSVSVRVPVGPIARRRLRRMLGGHRLLTARVRVLAVGPTGRRTVLTRSYLVGR